MDTAGFGVGVKLASSVSQATLEPTFKKNYITAAHLALTRFFRATPPESDLAADFPAFRRRGHDNVPAANTASTFAVLPLVLISAECSGFIDLHDTDQHGYRAAH